MKKFIFILLMTSLSNSFAAVYLKVVYIADYKSDCGIGKCILTRDAPTDSFTVFNNNIEGFTYEEGFEYCILMEIQTPGVSEPAIPFDSTQIKYVLSEIKSKVKTKKDSVTKNTTINSAITGSSKWMLYKLKMKDGSTRTFSIQKAFLQFDTKNNTISGSTECNGFTASVDITENTLIITNANSTLLACGKRSIEPAFLEMLKNTTHYKATSKLLYLYKDKKLLGLFTRKK
jgi:heat shock protein HslJ